MSKHTTDVAVIGAGIIGASCADQLSQRGLRVTVVESLEAAAMGSTGKSAAGVRVQFTTETNIRMSRLSLPIYRDFLEVHGIDVGYQPIGYLLLVPPDRWEAHQESVALQRSLGVPVELLSPEEATRYVEMEVDGLAGATFGPMDGVVDPHSAAHAYVQLSRRRGVEYRFDCPVRAITRVGGCWRLELPDGSLEAHHVVNAAGAWSGRVASMAGLELPVRPMRCMIFLTSPVEDPRTYPLTIDIESGFYLRSEGNRVLFGLTNENEAFGFVEGMNWDWLDETLVSGLPRFPWLEEVGLDRGGCWWGYYEVTPDHNPVIGRHPDAENWVDATGFSGHGIMHAPATGLLVAEIIQDGQSRTISTEAFRHGRFGEGGGDANIF